MSSTRCSTKRVNGFPLRAFILNAVCHQGVPGAALAVEDDLDLLAALLASAEECLRIFLGGFGADGSTSEGPSYWSYGFGRFAELNRQLETATNGAFSFFGNSEH